MHVYVKKKKKGFYNEKSKQITFKPAEKLNTHFRAKLVHSRK